MKNKLLLFTTVIIIGVLPIVSLAQTSTSTGTIKKETIQDKIEAKKEIVANSVQQIKRDAMDKIKAVIDKFIQNVTERFDAANGRLEKLADRIASRIAKMEAKNVDVTKAIDLLATAKAKIEVAKTSVASVTPDIESVATTTTTSMGTLKEDFKIIKTQIATAKENIKAARAALVDVVNSLKPGDNKLKSSETNN